MLEFLIAVVIIVAVVLYYFRAKLPALSGLRAFMPSSKVTGFIVVGIILIGGAWLAWNTFGVSNQRAAEMDRKMVGINTGTPDTKGRTMKDCAEQKEACLMAGTNEVLVPKPEVKSEVEKNDANGVGKFFADTKNAIAKIAPAAKCPTEVLSIVYDTRITIPLKCKVTVDATMVRDGDFEYEFADASRPIVNGSRVLNGKTVQSYLTHSFGYTGRSRYGMRFTATNSTTWSEANVDVIEIVILPKGTTLGQSIDLTPAAIK